MSVTNVVSAVVKPRSNYTVTSPIMKEDKGQVLHISGLDLPNTYEIDFSNDRQRGSSVTMIGNADGVLIPTQFIKTGRDVYAFYYYVGDGFGQTEHIFRIPNQFRPDRTDETPEPEQQSVIDQAISTLNSAVAQTAQDVIDADASAQSASADADRAEEAKTDAQNFATQAEQSATSASQSASQASASATASANSASQSAQIKDDVEGMVDDAQASASASAQSASASANSASQASASATSASQSATSAQGYASQAQTSAQTASAKASEAGTSASTASTKASEALSSALSASGYATQAESAKTASQTAQGLAESARDSAQGYAEDAQGYAEDAQASAESISASASQIAQNTADTLKAFPTDTASGAVASFSDGADDIPLKSLIVNIDPVQDTSSGDPSPENICPISGWTGCEVNTTGINVWDEQWESGGYAYGNTSADSSRIRSKNYIPVMPNTIYYFKKGVNNGNMWAFYYDRNKVCLNRTVNGHNVGNGAVTTPDNCHYIRFFLSAQTEYQHDVAINYPSTDHDYHPYQGRTIPISLGQTVYGGKLDVLSGELVVDRAKVLLDGTNREQIINTTSDIANCAQWDGYSPIGTSRAIFVSNTLKSATPYSSTVPKGLWEIWCSALKPRMWFSVPKSLTNDVELSAYLAENPIDVVYPLATPLEIQLTPQQVNSLLGVNNIWADSGDCSVEYRADTKLFIERLTAPDSADMVADSAITSGQFFMVGNTLYRALANIASGATITIGTNAQRVSLSDALNLVNA